MPPKEDALARFWRKAERRDDGCWEWTGRVKTNGYGTFFPSRRHSWNAHRWAYTVLVGPIPEGMQLDHRCRNRRCVNPAHLEPVSPALNASRAAAMRTHCPHGHPYDEENTGWWGGHRHCRTCNAEQCAEYASRHRAELTAYRARYYRGRGR
jgi:hypothetical protein